MGKMFLDFLASEQGMALLMYVVAAVVGLLKGTDLWQKYTKGKYDDGVDSILAGVKHTYDTEVEAAKAALPPGESLSIDQKRSYRQQAFDKSVEIAKSKGVDLVKTIGEDKIKVLVQQAVNTLKGKPAGTITTP